MAKGHQQARSPPGYSLGDLGPTGRDKGEKRLHDPVYVPVSFGVKPGGGEMRIQAGGCLGCSSRATS